SDKSGASPKWIFQQRAIPAKGFLIVFASGKDRQHSYYAHTNFKIAQGEESVYLYHSNGQIVSYTDNRFIPQDHTIGRLPDGSDYLFHIKTPTPETSNNTAEIVLDAETVLLSLSHQAGIYSQPFYL